MANNNSYAMIETPHHQNYSVDDLRTYLDSRPNTPGNYSGNNSPIWPASPAWPRESMAGSQLALNPKFPEPDSPGFPPSPAFPPHSPGFPPEEKEKEEPKPPARPPGPPGGPPPDGGLTAWLQVAGGFFLFMNTWGIINAYGTFQSYYKGTLLVDSGYAASDISWIGTITSFFLCASPIMWGPVFDRGNVRILVFVGAGCVVFGLMMTSLAKEYWHLILAQGIVVGLGGGCTFLTATSILPTYFAKKRSLVMGIAASGSSMGGIIYPITFHMMLPQVGFGWAVRTIGFISLATLSIPCAVMRPRVPKPSAKRKIFDLKILKELPFALVNVATFFGFVGQYIPFFFIAEYAMEHNIGMAFWMTVIINAGSLPGRIIPSLIADRYPPLLVLGCCTTSATLLAFCWVAVGSSQAGLIIWALLYGFCAGAFVSLQGPCVASMTTDMRTIGTRFGLNMFCGACGILIGSPVGGAIFPQSWAGAGSFCGGTLLVSTIFIALTYWAINREKTKGSKRLSG